MGEVEVTVSQEFRERHPDLNLPAFCWLKVTGTPGQDDFALSEDCRLLVSERAKKLLDSAGLNHCDVEEWAV